MTGVGLNGDSKCGCLYCVEGRGRPCANADSVKAARLKVYSQQAARAARKHAIEAPSRGQSET